MRFELRMAFLGEKYLVPLDKTAKVAAKTALRLALDWRQGAKAVRQQVFWGVTSSDQNEYINTFKWGRMNSYLPQKNKLKTSFG